MSRPKTTRLVDVALLQAAILRSDVSLYRICMELGWTKRDSRSSLPGWSERRAADTTRLRRMVGLAPHHDRRFGYTHGRVSRRINYDTAVRIALIIGVDPVDVGL